MHMGTKFAHDIATIIQLLAIDLIPDPNAVTYICVMAVIFGRHDCIGTYG